MLRPATSRLRSVDGTGIAVYATGREDGPTLLLANGLGGNVDTWRYLLAHFEPRFRILTWDYRGLYRSGRPPDHQAYRMEDHVLDAVCVLDHFGVERAVVLGWSMGVQLNFELARSHPGRVAAIIAINGTFGNPLHTAFNGKLPKPLAPLLLALMRRSSPVMPLLAPLLARPERLLAFAKKIGLAGAGLREEVAVDLIEEYVRLDFDAYASIFEHLADHDASDFLPQLNVPSLILAGEKDLFTPPRCSREMAALVPGARMEIMPGATHYAPVECPDAINASIERFLQQVAMGEARLAANHPGV